MFRRLNRENLADSNPLPVTVNGEADTFKWSVYDEYEFKIPRGRGRLAHFVAKEGAARRKIYEPLVDTPHLFLDFARLQENKDGAALVPWLHENGLLGLHPEIPQGFSDSDSWMLPAKPWRLYQWYDNRGGPVETATVQLHEAKAANRALRMYEAALSRDEAKLEEALFDEGPQGKAHTQILLNIRTSVTGADRVDALIDVVSQALLIQVGEVLNAFAYPTVTLGVANEGLTSREPLNLGSLTSSLWPRNLLGAMYLQFYWLITSGDVTRCKFCNGVISLAPAPRGKGRKVRADKQFCDSHCRQNHHYHTKVKPTR